MKTVKVTFARKFVEGLDVLYTYKTEDFVEVGDFLTNSDDKSMQVISVDSEYDLKTEKKYGELKYATP